MPKLVIANDEAVAAWLLSPKPGICVIEFESVVTAPPDTV
jgi:hypothetical protein